MKAIITGATRGVGRAIAHAFANLNYDIALGARSLEDLENLKKELLKKGSKEVLTRTVDFSSKFETINFAEAIEKAWGKVDIIVNNVGTYSMGKIDEEGADVMNKLMQINFYSAYYTTTPFLKGMREQKKGFIFNICSIVSKEPRVDAPAYTISKQALHAFNEVLRLELQPHGIKVTAIYPGSINTSSWDGIDAPTEKFVQPEDIANAITNVINSSDGVLFQEITLRPIDKNF